MNRSRLLQWCAALVALTTLITLAIITPGFDTRVVQPDHAEVWVARTDGKYARVNTETREITTVRSVDAPAGIVQFGASSVLLTQGYSKAWAIDPTHPTDLTAPATETADSAATEATTPSLAAATTSPAGTRDVVAAGEHLLFLTENGEVWLSHLSAPGSSIRQSAAAPEITDPLLLDPFDGAEVTTATLDADGNGAVFSRETGEVRLFTASTGVWQGSARTITGWEHTESDTAVQLRLMNKKWVLFDPESGQLWRQGSKAVRIESSGNALLQRSTTAAESAASNAPDIFLADDSGLWRITATEALRELTASGTPTEPTSVRQRSSDQPTIVATWMNDSAVTLWSSETGVDTLVLDTSVPELGDPDPRIFSNGLRAVLVEARTGMMWSLPQGTLIPLSQWSETHPPTSDATETLTEEPTDPQPPVAVSDTFGVRPGEPTNLPVLLNDYDPNRGDVLSIVADTVAGGLDPAFGTIAIQSDQQSLVVTPSPAAAGSATLSYTITDGSLTSETATITLSAIESDVNTAPQWCGVTECQRSWPSPEITPGGTLVFPALDGWVDPEGDPLVLSEVVLTDSQAPAKVVATADGHVVLRHTDPNSSSGDIGVMLRVADSRGAVSERELTVRVAEHATPVLASSVLNLSPGETATATPLSLTSGGSGEYELVDAAVQVGVAEISPSRLTGEIGVTASEPGASLITVTVRDLVTLRETTGTIRVAAHERSLPMGFAPLSAYLRPLTDTTVDVLAALPTADTHGASVRSAAVRDGNLQAEVLAHAHVRITSSDPNTNPSATPTRLGSIDVVAVATDETATGRVTVYQVPEGAPGAVIARNDSVTVRAGAIADIPVLTNDAAALGEHLTLHPEISGSGGAGELATASGNVIRYIAPELPGTYTLGYTVYATGAPEHTDTGTVRVTVVEPSGNRAPQPETVTVRVAPGSTEQISVPLSGVDPDGDRVRLIGVSEPTHRAVTAAIGQSSGSITVTARDRAVAGVSTLTYTVRDTQNAEAQGTLRVIITDPSTASGSPVAYSDSVRIPVGDSGWIPIRPTDNDTDPAGGTLEILSVVPYLPGGETHPEYSAYAERLDLSEMHSGVIRVRGSDTPGATAYTVTVRSAQSTSTAQSTLTVHVTARVGMQAPTVADTVLTAGQRAQLEDAGVDVLTDRVQWSGGDRDTLRMALWGEKAERYRVHGNRISGDYSPDGDTVPFLLTGTDTSGAEITTVGVLFIPPLDELRITLKPQLPPLTVDEEGTTAAPIAELVELGSGDRAELATGSFPVQREQATCSANTPEELSYQAGREAPWRDVCSVRVKLSEQTRYSVVQIPITVVPDEPEAQLNALTRTISPGETHTITLTDMLTWYGNRTGQAASLVWAADGKTDGFDVKRSGTSLTVTAHADAVPGSQQSIPVTVSGAGQSTAPLTLRVGAAAPDRPRGATVALNCTVGESCEASLVGQPGEYDPYANAPAGGLQVVSLTAGQCTYGTLTAEGNRVRVSWPDQRGPGGQCTVRYTVRDAQHRTGTGSIEFDAQGVPSAPSSITQVGYSEDAVRLFVAHGAAAQAYPALTDIVIDQDGERTRASCTRSGSGSMCTVAGLTAGESHRFTARAVNRVGESDQTQNAVTAWAYRTPAAPTVTVTQLSAESPTSATLRFRVSTADGSTGGYRVVVNGAATEHEVGTQIDITAVAVGSARWEVIPVSQFAVPAGDTADGARTSGSFSVAGLPTVSMTLESPAGSDTVRVNVRVAANGGSLPQLGVSAAPNGQSEVCDPRTAGTTHSTEITGTKNRTLRVTACAKNEWGSSANITQTILVGGELEAPTVTSGYAVAATPKTLGSGIYEYGLETAPVVTAHPEATLEFEVQGQETGSLFPGSVDPERTLEVRVRQRGEESVSSWANITGNVPATVRVHTPDCLTPEASTGELTSMISAAARPHAQISVTDAELKVQWTGPYAPLAPLTVTIPGCEPQLTSELTRLGFTTAAQYDSSASPRKNRNDDPERYAAHRRTLHRASALVT